MKRLLLLLAMLPLAVMAQNKVYVDDMDLSFISSGWKSPQPRRAVDNDSIIINGKYYARGVGSHATCVIPIALNGTAERFYAEVGIDDKIKIAAMKDKGSATVGFFAVVDGKVAWKADTVRWGKTHVMDIDLRGAKNLYLVADQLGGSHHDHVDWGEAWITYQGQKTPHTLTPGKEEPYILTPAIAAQPMYNGASRYGASTGKPLLIRLAFSGEQPLKYVAKGLPKGVTLDPNCKALIGAVNKAGTYPITITASNKKGKAVAKLDLVIGGPLFLSPPMGWNSWNAFGMNIDATKILTAAQVMDQELADFGYSYVNTDDGWQGERGKDGYITGNEGFPDLGGMVKAIHRLGLKAGIYSSPGPKTCGGKVGSKGFETQDATSFSKWGFDLLKHDWCSMSQFVKNEAPIEEHAAPYILMAKELKKQPRDIALSLCQYGNKDVEKWGAAVGGSYWRTTGDIVDNWDSMTQIIDLQDKTQPYSKPGAFNDPDMLVVGHMSWGRDMHPSKLLPTEQYYHISMWAMLSAPMLLGCDLSKLDAFTKGLLTNREVNAINQDALCVQAKRIYQDNKKYPFAQDTYIEVWSKPLANGDLALCINNRGNLEANYTLNLADLGISGYENARDVWRQADLGKAQGLNLKIRRHGVQLLRLRK